MNAALGIDLVLTFLVLIIDIATYISLGCKVCKDPATVREMAEDDEEEFENYEGEYFTLFYAFSSVLKENCFAFISFVPKSPIYFVSYVIVLIYTMRFAHSSLF